MLCPRSMAPKWPFWKMLNPRKARGMQGAKGGGGSHLPLPRAQPLAARRTGDIHSRNTFECRGPHSTQLTGIKLAGNFARRHLNVKIQN